MMKPPRSNRVRDVTKQLPGDGDDYLTHASDSDAGYDADTVICYTFLGQPPSSPAPFEKLKGNSQTSDV